MKYKLISLVLAGLLLSGCAAGNAAPVDRPEASTTAATAPTTPTRISQQEAKNIALKHAGFTESQVTVLRAEYEFDDGVPEYEVEFRKDATEYDYTIHAITGEVLHWNKEEDRQTAPVPTESAEKLTADEAKAIALKHAGLTEDQVKGLRAEYEFDDGVPEYEVEFRKDTTEYDYTIHATTGEILRWEQDR